MTRAQELTYLDHIRQLKEAVTYAQTRLDSIRKMSSHCIPMYAYGDHEAACAMADRLDQIADMTALAIERLAKAKERDV